MRGRDRRRVTDEQLAEHKPLVLWQIQKMGLRPVPELVGAGMYGLWMALRGYQADRGRFATYATRCIRGQVLEALRKRRGISRKDREAVSLSTPVARSGRGGEAIELGETLPAREAPARHFAADFWRRVARHCVDRRAGQILLRYYRDGLTFKEVGAEHGISKARVQQIVKQAIERLGRRTRPEMFEE